MMPLRMERPAAPGMNSELRELAILRAARERSRGAATGPAEPKEVTSPAAGSAAGSQLLLMYDDVVLSILDQLRQSRNVASLVACLASSRQLSSLSRDVLRENFPLFLMFSFCI